MRTQLQAKEKELLGLQRTNPCLLAPDPDQVDILLDAIASLQLSTPEGSFVFSSDSDCDDTSSCASVCSVEFNSIKTLPSTVWLPESHLVEQQHGQRSSIADHLLSLPINAYLASSSKTQNQLIHRSPVVSDLLSMSVDAFKSSSNTSASIEIKNDKNVYVYLIICLNS